MNDSVKLEITVDDKGSIVVKNFKETVTGATGEASEKAKTAETSFASLWKGMALGQGVFTAIHSGLRMFKNELGDSIKTAIDAEETHSKFGVVFSEVAKQAGAAARDLADNWGLSKYASETMLSATGDLLTGLGLTGAEALELSTKTQQLAIDLASFTNYAGGSAGASEALTKAMLGEREMAKGLGIVLSEETIQQELLRVGKNKLTGTSLLQAKAEATLTVAMNQSKNAMGDYARTSDSTANTIKRMQAIWEDIKVSIGGAIVQTIGPALKDMKTWFDDNRDAVASAASVIVKNLSDLAKMAISVGKAVIWMGKAFADAVDFLRKLSPVVNAVVEGWQKLLILFTDELGDVYDKLGESINREAEMQKKSIDRFRESAKAVGATKDEIHKLVVKYKDVEDAGIKHERMLRDLIKTHPELADKLKKTAKVTSDLGVQTKIFGDNAGKTTDQLKEEADEIKRLGEITKKYGLEVAGFNEAGREMYFQLLQIVGLLPKFTKESQSAAEGQAWLGVELMRTLGLLPPYSQNLLQVKTELEKQVELNEKWVQGLTATIKKLDTLSNIFKALGLDKLAAAFGIAGDAVYAFQNQIKVTTETINGMEVSTKSLEGGLLGFLGIGLMVANALEEAFGSMYENMQNMLDGLLNALIAINIELAKLAIYKALEDLKNGSIGPLLPEWTGPDISAASGFYSPRLSSDTLIQAHAGEEVRITPASANVWNSPRTGSDGAPGGVTVIVQQENNLSFSGVSGTDREVIAEKVNSCLEDNVRGVRDTVQRLING